MVDTHRVRSPEERRRLELARRRYARRFRRIEDLKRRGPQFIMVLLALLAIALILYRLFGPELLTVEDEEILDTFDETVAVQETANVRVDPELLRTEITSFEEVLLGERAARGLDELTRSIATEAGLLAEKARQLSEEHPRLVDLEQRVEALASEVQTSSFDLERLEEIRRQWFDIRVDTLHRAPWLASTTTVVGEDASALAAYRDAATALLDLVESARSEAEYFSERIAEGENISSDWRDYESEFFSELREIELTIPAERPGTGASAALLGAIQKLEQAVDFTRERVAVEVPTNPLNRSAYDRGVDSAQAAVDAFEAAWE